MTGNKDRLADQKQIEEAAANFLKAMASRDAREIGQYWTDEGELHIEGRAALHGRAAIEQAYAEFFAEHPAISGRQLHQTIRFLAKDLAIEDGAIQLETERNKVPTTGEYGTLWVREEGKWRMAYSHEWEPMTADLSDLGFLTGTWTAKQDGAEMTLAFKPAGKRFMEGTFSVSRDGQVIDSGTQRIGIDPSKSELHSWVFSADGGVGEGVWYRDGDHWVVESASVLADGRHARSRNLITRVDSNTITFQSTDRSIEGEPLPNTVPVRLGRVADTQPTGGPR